MIRLLFLLALFGVFLPGCSRDNMIVTKTSELSYQDTLDFRFDTTLSSESLISLSLTHADNFPYQNVYFNIGLQVDDHDMIFSNHSIQLSSQDGVWLGKCSSGLCLITSSIELPIELSDRGSLQVSLVQNSREASLKGIHSIGVGLK